MLFQGSISNGLSHFWSISWRFDFAKVWNDKSSFYNYQNFFRRAGSFNFIFLKKVFKFFSFLKSESKEQQHLADSHYEYKILFINTPSKCGLYPRTCFNFQTWISPKTEGYRYCESVYREKFQKTMGIYRMEWPQD